MSNPRRRKRIDTNQTEIVKELLTIPGVSVEKDCNDILVGFRGRTYWYEIKNPNTISKKTGEVREKKIQESQKKLRATWTGHYRIIWTLDQILEDINN